MLDVIILSNAKTEYLKTLTAQALSTLKNSGTLCNVFIHEQNEAINYDGATRFHVSEPFNYNRFMNEGAMLGKSKYIAFCNNDLEFETDWAYKLIYAMERDNLDSASPYCRNVHGIQTRLSPTGVVRLGWTVRLEFAGWCFVMKRSSWEKIGGLDEDFSFWCADNATVEQLKAAGMKHGLVTNSIVNHVASGENTLKDVDPATKEQLTFVQIKKFNNKYDKNVWGMGK